jgi:NADH:ubiquinone oxidoreductase subunit 3 (subunit A)
LNSRVVFAVFAVLLVLIILLFGLFYEWLDGTLDWVS